MGIQTHGGNFQFYKILASIFGLSVDVRLICPRNKQVIIRKPNEENTSKKFII